MLFFLNRLCPRDFNHIYKLQFTARPFSSRKSGEQCFDRLFLHGVDLNCVEAYCCSRLQPRACCILQLSQSCPQHSCSLSSLSCWCNSGLCRSHSSCLSICNSFPAGEKKSVFCYQDIYKS